LKELVDSVCTVDSASGLSLPTQFVDSGGGLSWGTKLVCQVGGLSW